MIPLDAYGLTGEPTASSALASGATLVLMSGDKLLGGPQAGIILGTSTVVAKLRKNPFARAMRVDTLTRSALDATLRLYLEPDRAVKEIPVLAMLTESAADIESRAHAVARTLGDGGITVEITATKASVGGGAFPTAEIPSAALALQGNATELEEKLRHADPPVIGRIADGKLLLDLRAVLPREHAILSRAVLQALA
jgi:L-seryl-tRNA(Ser) seleniumtransferase